VSKKFFSVICGVLVLCIALTPVVSSASVNPAETNRAVVINRLEQLGATPKQASAAVAMLNTHDLATLAAHPQMIHRAGATDTGRELFWGIVIVLIVVGITAICVNI
jgi:hypothetical protein